MKVFVDSNIVLDVLLGRDEFYETSAEALSVCMGEDFTGATSALSICNMVYVMRKYMPARAVEEKVLALLDVVDLIDTTGRSVRQCLGEEHVDFEDAVQLAPAIEWGADVIITRDKYGFSRSIIPVCTPSEFLAKY